MDSELLVVSLDVCECGWHGTLETIVLPDLLETGDVFVPDHVQFTMVFN